MEIFEQSVPFLMESAEALFIKGVMKIESSFVGSIISQTEYILASFSLSLNIIFFCNFLKKIINAEIVSANPMEILYEQCRNEQGLYFFQILRTSFVIFLFVTIHRVQFVSKFSFGILFIQTPAKIFSMKFLHEHSKFPCESIYSTQNVLCKQSFKM